MEKPCDGSNTKKIRNNIGRLATLDEIKKEIRDIVSDNEGIMEFDTFNDYSDASVDFLNDNNFFETD